MYCKSKSFAPELFAVWPAARELLGNHDISDIDTVDPDRCQLTLARAIDSEGFDGPCIAVQQLLKSIRRGVRQVDLGKATADVRAGFRRVEVLQPDVDPPQPEGVAVYDACLV